MPKPEKAVSFEQLKESLKKAGYALDSADISISGKILRDGDKWLILNESSGQKFLLESRTIEKFKAEIQPDSTIEIEGSWKTVGKDASAREVIEVQSARKAENQTKTKTVGLVENTVRNEKSTVRFLNANFTEISPLPIVAKENEIKKPLAPIRTTSPGLTVFQGGAVTPRLYFVKQHFNNLDVSRQILDVSVSYTPTTKLQLEAEIPFTHTSFDDGANEGANAGLGNIVLWGKYRFFRKVKTYGDRQASFRFGLELPTGNKTAPSAQAVNAPDFIRRQLTANNGGLSPRFDIAFSQAGGRFIFGGNVEAIVRTERNGFRLGNEVRLNTDFEYVLLPIDYTKPGKELFLILETTLMTRGRGRLNGLEVAGSSSTEFFLAPGLQFAAHPQFVVEGSFQFPVFQKGGSMMLKTDYNLLLGVKYLF